MMPRAQIKRYARLAVATTTFYSGYCFVSALLRPSPTARILCYHSVSDSPADSFAVTPDDFARQIEFLAKRFGVVSVDELADELRYSDKPLSSRVAVTFDDGYQDFYTKAYPVLRRWSVPATVFLPVKFIVSGSSGVPDRANNRPRFLSWDQVREMREGGIDFGSHTADHVVLSTLTSQQARYQLEVSKARIEEELQQSVRGFSYPYGTARDFTAETRALAQEVGYSWAVSGLNGVNTQRTDLFALRRTGVGMGDSMYVFDRLLRGALDPWVIVDRFGWMIHQKRPLGD